ncbi:Hypothetical protein FKW44_014703 [Caligus rogercresseyi]|uniref:Uncharacterized protein n=1 Tax=Caligus rogercresseyi TaxID=217165 RepID=A0A7T8JZ69_CALRO|nr:Hypothetical protein FKW44_014703 [Caligus rogercresseyi]
MPETGDPHYLLRWQKHNKLVHRLQALWRLATPPLTSRDPSGGRDPHFGNPCLRGSHNSLESLLLL